MRKRAFTLIELIAVLVILAIIILIVTPIVINIIKKINTKANMRSVDYYAKSAEIAIHTYLLDNGKYPDDFEDLKIDYSGKEVKCDVEEINDDGTVYLTKCKVENKLLYKEDNNYYTYGRLNPNYEVYKVGDCIEEGTYVNYKDSKWCVISDSSRKQDYVTLIKYIPLTFGEVSHYGQDENGRRFFNQYDFLHSEYEGTYSYDNNTVYLGLARYYTSNTCGYLTAMDINSLVETNCNNNYELSDIKKIVDNYSNSKLNLDDLKKVNGYKVRLITKEELINNFHYENDKQTESTPKWIYENASIWTMSKVEDTNNKVYIVDKQYGLNKITVWGGDYVYRYGYVSPVINLLKEKI